MFKTELKMNGLGRLSSLSLLAPQKTTVHSLQRCFSLISTSQNCRSTFSALPSSIFRPLGQISGFLKPVSVVNTAQAVAGLKHVANPRRRCKHCWATIKDERKYIFCDKHPRHKQVKHSYNTTSNDIIAGNGR